MNKGKVMQFKSAFAVDGESRLGTTREHLPDGDFPYKCECPVQHHFYLVFRAASRSAVSQLIGLK